MAGDLNDTKKIRLLDLKNRSAVTASPFNIAPKLKNIRNTLRKQGFFDISFSILCLFMAILAQELNSFICKKNF
jgi:hypothetical protein